MSKSTDMPTNPTSAIREGGEVDRQSMIHAAYLIADKMVKGHSVSNYGIRADDDVLGNTTMPLAADDVPYMRRLIALAALEGMLTIYRTATAPNAGKGE